MFEDWKAEAEWRWKHETKISYDDDAVYDEDLHRQWWKEGEKENDKDAE